MFLFTVSTAFILIQQHYTAHTIITHALHKMCILVDYTTKIRNISVSRLTMSEILTILVI